jgi:hypothetical protein
MVKQAQNKEPHDDPLQNPPLESTSDWAGYAPTELPHRTNSSTLSLEISALVDQFKQARNISDNEFSTVGSHHDLKVDIFGKLIRLAQDENSSAKHEAIEALLEIVPSDGTKFMKDQLCELLSKNPEHMQSIVEFVFDPSHKQIRLYAANLLRHEIKKDPELAEQIMKIFYSHSSKRGDSGKIFLEGVCLGLSESSSNLAHGFLQSVIRDTGAPREAQLFAKIGLSRA